jgi:hypothetical protein
MHMATIQLWAEIFDRKAPSREALSRHITGLLLHGLEPARHRKRNATSGRK